MILEIILSLLIGYFVWVSPVKYDAEKVLGNNYVVLARFRQFIFQPPHSPKQDGSKSFMEFLFCFNKTYHLFSK